MSTLPKWWFGPPPELGPGEKWEGNFPANRSQGRRAVGGGLHFTNMRALFTPNVIDAALGGRAWSSSLRDIAEVGVEPARLSPLELFSGGLRPRLRIAQRNGDKSFFVIAAPGDVAASLQLLLGRGR